MSDYTVLEMAPDDIRRWRIRRRIRQQDLANMLRVNVTTVSHWENGRRDYNRRFIGVALYGLDRDYPPLLTEEQANLMMDAEDMRKRIRAYA